MVVVASEPMPSVSKKLVRESDDEQDRSREPDVAAAPERSFADKRAGPADDEGERQRAEGDEDDRDHALQAGGDQRAADVDADAAVSSLR